MPRITSKELDGRNLIKKAEQSGLRVEYGRGDHVKVFAPQDRGYQVIPARPIGRGLACAIVKWLIGAGVSFIIILGIFSIF